MGLQKFLSSKAGRRFYNFAYCWGACLVILGAVFKIAHMPYDTLFLMVGLVTEVSIFFISGFDVPPTEYKWERIFPELEENCAKAEKRMISRQQIDEKLDEKYAQQVKILEENVVKLNKAYESQLSKIEGCADSIDPQAFSDLQSETKALSDRIKLLNEQYDKMLGAMNVKK